MKVLLINGSPRGESNTHLALDTVAKVLNDEGIETEIFWIGIKPVQGCVACYKCTTLCRCIFHDELYEALIRRADECDAIIIGTPTYFAGAAGSLCAILDRLFFSAGRLMYAKPAAAVAVARRGGATEAFDRLNKYFSINAMPVVGAQYWNIVYGAKPGEAALDEEGMQTMRLLGRDMAWMLKALHNEKAPKKPQPVPRTPTNFIREGMF